MTKVFSTTFLIFGMFVGAGFASGNEIVVFFSRFGSMSYIYVAIAVALLFFVLFFFLQNGKKFVEKLEGSKILNFLMFCSALVFASSMFAGTINLSSYFPMPVQICFLVALLAFSFYITNRGLVGIEKFNLVFMPILSILFFIVLCFSLDVQSGAAISNKIVGVFYAPLYVALNISMGILVLSKQGERLTKKQAIFSSLLSCALLLIFLLLGNFILLNNANVFVSEMPFLDISRDIFLIFSFEFFVIFCGCFSTLIVLCFTIKNLLKKYVKNNLFCVFLSVFLPYIFASVGFSRIISFLYPIVSVFGIFIVLFSIFFFKQTDKIIHPKSEKAKDKS